MSDSDYLLSLIEDINKNNNINNISIDLRTLLSNQIKDITKNIKKQEKIINGTYANNKILTKNINYLNQLVSAYTKSYDDLFHSFMDETYRVNNLNVNFTSLISALKSLPYILEVTKSKNNILLVGPNGAGKTSFASLLSKANFDNLLYASAERFLFFYPGNINDVENYSISNIATDKSGAIRDSLKNNQISNVLTDFEYSFTHLLNLVALDYIKEIKRIAENQTDNIKKTDFSILKSKFEILFPNLLLDINPAKFSMYIKEAGEDRPINTLSSGERTVLYFLCIMVKIPSDSTVLIDEPENNLNPALYKKLWNIITQFCSSSKFIFITHSQEFISSNSDSDLFWLSESNPEKQEFSLNSLSGDFLPRELTSQLVGSNQSVLFCEGIDDVLIYKMLYPNLLIISVDGHNNVIKYTNMLNNKKNFTTSLFNYSAYGIIDGDGLMDKKDFSLCYHYPSNNKNMYLLPYNEIEMLLLDEDVVKTVFENNIVDHSVVEKKVEEFKNKLFIAIDGNQELRKDIIKSNFKSNIDFYDNFINMKNIINNISDNDDAKIIYNLNKYYQNLSDQAYNFYHNLCVIYDKTITNKDYNQLLKLCSLKNGLKNIINKSAKLSDYFESARAAIKNNADLRKNLIKKIDINFKDN